MSYDDDECELSVLECIYSYICIANSTIYMLDLVRDGHRLRAIDGKGLEDKMCQEYLGRPSDRSLSFISALDDRAKKLKVRNNLESESLLV